jgi:hypothetical protein
MKVKFREFHQLLPPGIDSNECSPVVAEHKSEIPGISPITGTRSVIRTSVHQSLGWHAKHESEIPGISPIAAIWY